MIGTSVSRVAQNQRRGNVARHVLQHDDRAAAQLGDGASDIRPFMQIDLDDAHAFVAVGFDALDVVHERCKLAFVEHENAILNIEGAHAVVRPDDAHDGDVDFGKNIHRHPKRGPDAEQANENDHRKDGVWTPQHERND